MLSGRNVKQKNETCIPHQAQPLSREHLLCRREVLPPDKTEGAQTFCKIRSVAQLIKSLAVSTTLMMPQRDSR